MLYTFFLFFWGEGGETENAGEAVIAELDKKNLQQYDTKFHWERERRKTPPPIFLFRRRQQHLTNLPPPPLPLPFIFQRFFVPPSRHPRLFPFFPSKKVFRGSKNGKRLFILSFKTVETTKNTYFPRTIFERKFFVTFAGP